MVYMKRILNSIIINYLKIMLKLAVAALLATTTLAFEYVEAYTNDLTPW